LLVELESNDEFALFYKAFDSEYCFVADNEFGSFLNLIAVEVPNLLKSNLIELAFWVD